MFQAPAPELIVGVQVFPVVTVVQLGTLYWQWTFVPAVQEPPPAVLVQVGFQVPAVVQVVILPLASAVDETEVPLNVLLQAGG
jgi:hypothetical protein